MLASYCDLASSSEILENWYFSSRYVYRVSGTACGCPWVQAPVLQEQGRSLNGFLCVMNWNGWRLRAVFLCLVVPRSDAPFLIARAVSLGWCTHTKEREVVVTWAEGSGRRLHEAFLEPKNLAACCWRYHLMLLVLGLESEALTTRLGKCV